MHSVALNKGTVQAHWLLMFKYISQMNTRHISFLCTFTLGGIMMKALEMQHLHIKSFPIDTMSP